MPRSSRGKRHFQKLIPTWLPYPSPRCHTTEETCVITEVLEGLTHSPGMRGSYRPKPRLVRGNVAAVRGQAPSRSIPGMAGS